MGIGQRLRSLDDRLLGKPKPRSTKTYRNIFLLGLVGSLTLLVLAAITGEGSYVAGVGGFLGAMLGSAVRWRASTSSHRKGSRPQRVNE